MVSRIAPLLLLVGLVTALAWSVWPFVLTVPWLAAALWVRANDRFECDAPSQADAARARFAAF